MALRKPNSGIAYTFGQKLTSAQMTNVVQDADDVSVGANITADANTTIDLVNGTTYRLTMTLSAGRVIALPQAPLANSRCTLKFGYTGNFALEVRVSDGGYTGQLVLTVAGAAGTREGMCDFYWDGSTWRTLAARIDASSSLTFTQ